jgi:predicted CoA-substrate-specific enzyme activase
LSLRDGQLIIPEYHASMGAIGAVYHLQDDPPAGERTFAGIEELERYLRSASGDLSSLDALHRPNVELCKHFVPPPPESLTDVYLGVDVGSLSTNVVLIDRDGTVVARRYLPTAGRPLEAIRRGLEEIQAEVGDRVAVRAAGTTGSGRYLTGDFIGADTIQNEITAQATGAVHFDPQVDTVFEIGGQDSKYLSIDGGVVVDFELNKVCAAGTGSFLEEQAEKLDINIVEEFGDMALQARRPSRLGDRCTVFMESDLNSHQQKGADRQSLVAGLACSIVLNYIQKVVGAKRIGDRILFQGGVANNRAVIAAFEKVTEKKIIVPPHFDVTGAIGAAILARDAVASRTAAAGNAAGGDASGTAFKGFQVSQVPYALDRFTCSGCANQCEIRRVRIEGERRPLFYTEAAAKSTSAMSARPDTTCRTCSSAAWLFSWATTATSRRGAGRPSESPAASCSSTSSFPSGEPSSRSLGSGWCCPAPSIADDEELKCVLDRVAPAYEESLQAEGFELIAWVVMGWTYVFSRQPVLTPEDLQPQKLWVRNGAAEETMAWKQAGFRVIPLSARDVMSSLSTGMVDAVVASPLAAAASQWFGIASNMCQLRVSPFLGAVVVAAKSWEQIPEPLRGPLLASARAIREADRRAVAVMQSHGLSVHSVPAPAQRRWRAVMLSFTESLLGKSVSREAHQTVMASLRACRGR